MKHICTLFLLFTFATQCICAQEKNDKGNTLPVKAKGDANGDRKVNATDIVCVLNTYMGHPSDDFDWEAADVNGDGEVDESDIIEIKNIIMKKASDLSLEWSNRSSIIIPTQPECAIVNISGISSMPVKKGTNAHAWMEVWDMNGIYFKKRVIVDLNGDSSTAKEKKNFAADFCEDEWIGDETTDIKIGDWVTQDGFHFQGQLYQYHER